jgi:hypothetical protein
MPGIDLNLDLPALSDSMATMVSKTAVALAAVEADLADPVTAAEIDINADLSLEGNAITNASLVHFTTGGATLPAGSMAYVGGEFFLATAAGEVQITLNGALDSGSVGGITGLGGTSAAVTFDDPSDEFRFTADTGDYADLRADDVVLVGTAGSVRLGVDAAITTARSIVVKSLPAAGVSGLVYNATTSTLEDAAVTRETTTHLFTGINVTGNIEHGDLSLSIGFGGAIATSGTLSGGVWLVGPPAVYNWLLSAAGVCVVAVPGMYEGQRIKTVLVKGNSANAGTITLTLQTYDSAVDLPFTLTGNFNTSGQCSCAITAPPTLAAGNVLFVRTAAGAGAVNLTHVRVTYDRPA